MRRWLHSAPVDTALILAPPFLSVALAAWLAPLRGVPLWAWVAFVLCIDVAHVYGTLFRTYLHPIERGERRALLVWVPVLCWLTGVMLYSVGAIVFWRVLAYVAVFHFIRQQYGLMRLYSRHEPPSWIDRALIYLAAGYPLVYWHAHLEERRFHWFVDGDFVSGIPPVVSTWVGAIYAATAALFVAQELRHRRFNYPKLLILSGTAASWYAGIVWLGGDMAFTITNVVSHGLPYIGLTWIYGRREEPGRPIWGRIRFGHVFRWAPLYVGLLIVLAYLEEGLWDGLVWRERLGFFPVFSELPWIGDAATLAWLVPLLSLPQSTHYVLDGFVWRLRSSKSTWHEVFFKQEVRGQ